MTSGYYGTMEVTASTNCLQTAWNNTFYTNESSLEITGLVPGCKYELNYRAMCFASVDDNNGLSPIIESTVSDSLCTGMLKLLQKINFQYSGSF